MFDKFFHLKFLLPLCLVLVLAIFYVADNSGYTPVSLTSKNNSPAAGVKSAGLPDIEAETALIRKKYSELPNPNLKLRETDNAIYGLAEEKNDSRYCAQIEDKYANYLCVYNLAKKNNDSSICQTAPSPLLRTNCSDRLNQLVAQNDRSIMVCAGISEENKRIDCFLGFVGEESRLEDCEKIPTGLIIDLFENNEKLELQSYCQDYLLKKQALVEKNARLCEEIRSSFLQGLCLADVSGISLDADTDKDGLTYKEELRYGTDLGKSDTDGDGFTDGAEIQNGHDPLK